MKKDITPFLLGLMVMLGIAAVNVVPTGVGTVNVFNYLESTNPLPATVFILGQSSFTNAAADIVIDDLATIDTSNSKNGLLMIDANGTDRALTLPTEWRVGPYGGTDYTVTNGTIAYVYVECWAGLYTNAYVSWVY